MRRIKLYSPCIVVLIGGLLMAGGVSGTLFTVALFALLGASVKAHLDVARPVRRERTRDYRRKQTR